MVVTGKKSKINQELKDYVLQKDENIDEDEAMRAESEDDFDDNDYKMDDDQGKDSEYSSSEDVPIKMVTRSRSYKKGKSVPRKNHHKNARMGVRKSDSDFDEKEEAENNVIKSSSGLKGPSGPIG